MIKKATTMGKASQPFNDENWYQHLQWLELVNNECRSNKLKRERKKDKDQSPGQKPENIARPSA